MANKDFKVKNGLDIQTPLPVSMGGTGQTSTTNTLNSLLPAQSGNSSKFLQTDGTNTTWATPVKGLNSGTLAQRPGSASNGDLYFNTDDMEIEVYQNGNWLIANVTPGIPTGVTATNQGSGRAFNNGQASVAFTASINGGPVKTFTVTPSPSTSPSTFTGTSSPISITGLASSTQYTYTVTASSNIGTSSASSASSGVTATTVPQAPTIGTATDLATSGNVSVAFTAGATGGSSITSYTVTSNPSNITASGASSPITVTGLTDGTSYTFTVTATNANGTSSASSASNSVTPTNDPSAFFPIATYMAPSGGSGSIVFSNIPQGYTHLQLRMNLRNTNPNNYATISINSGSYRQHNWFGTGTAPFIINTATTTEILSSNRSDSTTLTFSACLIDIEDYSSTSRNKVIRGTNLSRLDNTASGGHLWFPSMLSLNTAAVTSITITPSSGNFAQFSRATLYGWK